MDEASTATATGGGGNSVRDYLRKTKLFSLLLVALGEMSLLQMQAIAKLAVNNFNDHCVHLGRFINIKGEVQLKRKHWANYQLTAVGSVLCQGDLIKPKFGTRATVQCTDPKQNSWIIPSGKISGAENGCQPLVEEPPYTTTEPITPTRDPLSSRVPEIISPNRTWLLNSKPKLRWQSVPGATSYVVRVSGPGVNWVQEVDTTSVVYSGKPPLRPVEQGYLLTVQADNSESSAKAIFGLLEPTKAALVKAAQAQIDKQKLPEAAKTLALVELYIGQGLIAEATVLLEAAVSKGNQTAAVYYLLGELYTQVELFDRALNNYSEAVKRATTAKDIEGQMMAANRLAQIYQVIGEQEKAFYWLKQAQKGQQVLAS